MTGSESLLAQVGQTLLHSLRLGLELGQVRFELGDLLGLAPEPSLESVVPVLSAMVTPAAATATAAVTSAFAATATPSPKAMASRVPITVVVTVMPMAAMVFVMAPIMMMLVVFVSLVGGHEQPLFRPDRWVIRELPHCSEYQVASSMIQKLCDMSTPTASLVTRIPAAQVVF